jgi:hypothetical protein
MDLSRLLATDAGMHVVWDRAHFGNVRDYTSWERELLEHEDIERHIGAGELIPINIQSDGTFRITLRVASSTTPTLTQEESRRVVSASEPYRFVGAGHIDVSGIEFVSAEPDPQSVASAPLAAGEYEARVFLLDWDDVSARTDDQPDFVVLLGATSSSRHRTSASTFDRP